MTKPDYGEMHRRHMASPKWAAHKARLEAQKAAKRQKRVDQEEHYPYAFWLGRFGRACKRRPA